MSILKLTVYGQPAPQGSMVRGRYGGVHSSSKHLATWREAVRHEAAEARGDTITGAVVVNLTFTMRRPAKRKGWAIKRPDLDKLCRAVLDALTDAGVWKDDAQVIELMASKQYEGELGALESPGVEIAIKDLDDFSTEAARTAKHYLDLITSMPPTVKISSSPKELVDW